MHFFNKEKRMILENKSEYVDWNAAVPVIRYASLDETGCVEHGFPPVLAA